MTDTPKSDSPPLLADRVYGAVALVLLALAAFFAFRGGAEDGAPAPVPALTLIEPAASATVSQPVTLLFDAGGRLMPGPSGWTSGARHVHVRVDDAELMPGAGDIQPVQGTRYRWVLPRLPTGEHRLQLFWSDEAHRPLPDGSSAPVTVRVP